MPRSTPPPVGPDPAPAPPPAPAPAASPASVPAQVSVVNPSPMPDEQTAMAGRNVQLRILLRNGIQAPKTDNGEDVCLS